MIRKFIIVILILCMFPTLVLGETCDVIRDTSTDNKKELTCDATKKTVTSFYYSSDSPNDSNEENVVEETVKVDFGYTGDVQTFTAPESGNYQLEVWGAQGGYAMTNGKLASEGGYGGYSSGVVYLNKNETIYIYVGGKGEDAKNRTEGSKGGYNGGGDGDIDPSSEPYDTQTTGGREPGSGGGGATHISKVSGLLSTYAETNSIDKLLIVAGAGGGSAVFEKGGNAGGFKGTQGSLGLSICVGTQNDGYKIGVGKTAENAKETGKNRFNSGVSGGGSGFYGGCTGDKKNGAAGYGGSGYIGNSLLTDKVMYCYNCEESTNALTKTVSTTNVSGSAISNYAKKGNGYARITYTKTTVVVENNNNGNNTSQEYGYTGYEQTFTAPESGYYQLEVWGAQGGLGRHDKKPKLRGGYGGYSNGVVYLNKNETIYIYVGGKGEDALDKGKPWYAKGGYNGGGNGDIDGSTEKWDDDGSEPGSGGGGATHISKVSGLLSTYQGTNSIDNLLIVAGGGGGGAGYEEGGNAGGFKGTKGSLGLSTCVGTQSSGYVIGQGGAGVNGIRSGNKDWRVGTSGGGSGYYGGCGGNTDVKNNGDGGSAGSGGSGYIGNSLLTDKVMYCYNCEESTNALTKTVSTTNVSLNAISNYAKEGNGYAKVTYLKDRSTNSNFKNSVCEIKCSEELLVSIDPIKKVLAGGSFSYPLYVSGERKCVAEYKYNEYEAKIKKLVNEYEVLTGIDKENKALELANYYEEKKECDNFVKKEEDVYNNKYELNRNADVYLNVETSESVVKVPYSYVDIDEYSSQVLSDTTPYYNACNYNETTRKCDGGDETVSGWTEYARIYGKYTMSDAYIEKYTGEIKTSSEDDTCNAGDRYFVSLTELTRPESGDETDKGYSLTLVANNIGNNINTGGTKWDLTANCWYQVKNLSFPQKTDEMYEKIGGTGFMYRIIDLNNPFPGREAGANWIGKESIISSTKNKLNTLQKFVINLNSVSIGEIREYNDNHSYEPFVYKDPKKEDNYLNNLFIQSFNDEIDRK